MYFFLGDDDEKGDSDDEEEVRFSNSLISDQILLFP